MSFFLLFHYLLLNMFRMLIHLSSGVCDLFVELLHGLYCSRFDVCWCYGVVWLGWCGIRMQAEALLQPASGYHTTIMQHQHTSNQSNTTHAITQQISRKLLRMDVLTSETCWVLNNEVLKQVTSSWSLFIQLWKEVIGKAKTLRLEM